MEWHNFDETVKAYQCSSSVWSMYTRGALLHGDGIDETWQLARVR